MEIFGETKMREINLLKNLGGNPKIGTSLGIFYILLLWNKKIGNQSLLHQNI